MTDAPAVERWWKEAKHNKAFHPDIRGVRYIDLTSAEEACVNSLFLRTKEFWLSELEERKAATAVKLTLTPSVPPSPRPKDPRTLSVVMLSHICYTCLEHAGELQRHLQSIQDPDAWLFCAEDEMLVFHANGKFLVTVHSASLTAASRLVQWSRTHED